MSQVLILVAFLPFLACGIIWLFFNHGIDRLRHPEEWKDTGSSGERILYNTLIKKFNIPESQILRNVYVPTKDGKTSEIDLLVVSKKGIFIFECKNYDGNIYGDANSQKWVQYIGSKKNYFYNPLFQNRNHAKYLKEYLARDGIEVPIIPLVSTISRGKWKIKNLSGSDYFLGLNCHFKDIYKSMSTSESTIKDTILAKLAPLSRPDESVREAHVNNMKGHL